MIFYCYVTFLRILKKLSANDGRLRIESVTNKFGYILYKSVLLRLVRNPPSYFMNRGVWLNHFNILTYGSKN